MSDSGKGGKAPPKRPYKGKLQAVIVDLSGTTLDPGCFGNIRSFQKAFEAFGIAPTIVEIRAPMGVAKRDHITAILAIPRVAALWKEKYGADPDEKSADAVFAKLLEVVPDVLANYAQPAPGAVEALDKLRAQGVKVGACTAYSRSMMAKLLPEAREKGFDPDCIIASDEVKKGRPWPWMCWRVCEKLGVFPPEAALKIGDTPADIEEGLNAGMWSVGITRGSSAIGLSNEEAEALPPQELARREAEVAKKLRGAGAHFVISTMHELPAVCDKISDLLAAGETPATWRPESSKYRR